MSHFVSLYHSVPILVKDVWVFSVLLAFLDIFTGTHVHTFLLSSIPWAGIPGSPGILIFNLSDAKLFSKIVVLILRSFHQ